jgi:uncharacterized protein (DUF4415 family)
MNNSYFSPTSDDPDEYPKVTQADLNRSEFRIGLIKTSRKQPVTILLDTGLIEYFKFKAGECNYQALINDTLRWAIMNEDLEERLRRIIREELHRDLHTTPSK